MDIHFLEIVNSFHKSSFAKEILYKILHKMTTTILASVGIKTSFYTSHVIHKIIDNMILHQIKKTGLSHEFYIIFISAIWFIKMKINLSLFIHSLNIKFSLG